MVKGSDRPFHTGQADDHRKHSEGSFTIAARNHLLILERLPLQSECDHCLLFRIDLQIPTGVDRCSRCNVIYGEDQVNLGVYSQRIF